MLGSPKTDNQYHAGWAWAGSTPYKGTKLLASHLGGTRNPMAVRWPAKITPDATPRTQFHHCNDVVPTIYEVVGITPPRVVNGVPQDPIDGVSFAYTFDDPAPTGRLLTQYFEIMGSRAIYHDGWMASAFGPRAAVGAGPAAGHPRLDAGPGRLGALQPRRGLDPGQRPRRRDAGEARAAEGDCSRSRRRRTSVYPIGGGLWVLVTAPRAAHLAAVHGVDLRRRHHPDARVLRPGAGQQAQPRHHRRRRSRATPTACSTRSAAPAAASPASSTTASSATSTTCSSSCAPRSAPTQPLPAGPRDDRGRDRVRRGHSPAAR